MMNKSLETILFENGYIVTRDVPSKGLCGVAAMAYTYGLMVDCTEEGYESRYCYERREDAVQALANWTGDGDPPGPWVKHKGGAIPDRLGPGARG